MIRGRPPGYRALSWRRAAATSLRITGGRGGRVGGSETGARSFLAVSSSVA
jgi:hypothetical protein